MWKAQDETLARPVSVLTFAPGFPRILEVVTAARAASRLTDPRLAQVFDVEDGDDQAYIVMEWVSGQSLADLVAEGPLDPGRGCALVAEAARALAGAHAAGQAHLLLTPQSLRWTRSSGVKITGLGIDAALAGAGLANASDPALTDTRDLAGLLYAALTGYWPCESPTTLPPAPATDGEVCTPRQVSADVPTAIDAVVTRALLQRPVRQNPPILTPSAFADEIAGVAPPVPLPEPAPPSPPSYDGYGDRRSGYGGGYPGGQGGYQPTGGFGQAGPGGYGQAGPGRYAPTGSFAPDPNDPSTWNARVSGTPAYQRPYRAERSTASRAVISVVVVLVLAAVAAGAWAISNGLHGSGSNTGAGGQPSSSSSASSPSTSAAVLQPVGGQSFNVLGSSPTKEDQAHADDPINGKPPAWQTQQYASPDFGHLKKGDGYLIDMGKEVKATSVSVNFATPGDATAQIYISNTTSTTPGNTWPQPAYTAVTQPTQVSRDYTFNITSPKVGRYIIVWFTSLPSGANQESIAKVTVKGTAAG
jgi:serine/threonine protein kinase